MDLLACYLYVLDHSNTVYLLNGYGRSLSGIFYIGIEISERVFIRCVEPKIYNV